MSTLSITPHSPAQHPLGIVTLSEGRLQMDNGACSITLLSAQLPEFDAEAFKTYLNEGNEPSKALERYLESFHIDPESHSCWEIMGILCYVIFQAIAATLTLGATIWIPYAVFSLVDKSYNGALNSKLSELTEKVDALAQDLLKQEALHEKASPREEGSPLDETALADLISARESYLPHLSEAAELLLSYAASGTLEEQLCVVKHWMSTLDEHAKLKEHASSLALLKCDLSLLIAKGFAQRQLLAYPELLLNVDGVEQLFYLFAEKLLEKPPLSSHVEEIESQIRLDPAFTSHRERISQKAKEVAKTLSDRQSLSMADRIDEAVMKAEKDLADYKEELTRLKEEEQTLLANRKAFLEEHGLELFLEHPLHALDNSRLTELMIHHVGKAMALHELHKKDLEIHEGAKKGSELEKKIAEIEQIPENPQLFIEKVFEEELERFHEGERSLHYFNRLLPLEMREIADLKPPVFEESSQCGPSTPVASPKSPAGSPRSATASPSPTPSASPREASPSPQGSPSTPLVDIPNDDDLLMRVLPEHGLPYPLMQPIRLIPDLESLAAAAAAEDDHFDPLIGEGYFEEASP